MNLLLFNKIDTKHDEFKCIQQIDKTLCLFKQKLLKFVIH